MARKRRRPKRKSSRTQLANLAKGRKILELMTLGMSKSAAREKVGI